MEFIQCDAENLKLGANETFDAILCRWGLMFLPNLDVALSNMRRLLVSGGKLAALVRAIQSPVHQSIYGYSQKTSSNFITTLPSQGVPGSFSLADVDSLKKSLLKARFAEVRSEKIGNLRI